MIHSAHCFDFSKCNRRPRRALKVLARQWVQALCGQQAFEATKPCQGLYGAARGKRTIVTPLRRSLSSWRGSGPNGSAAIASPFRNERLKFRAVWFDTGPFKFSSAGLPAFAISLMHSCVLLPDSWLPANRSWTFALRRVCGSSLSASYARVCLLVMEWA